MRSNPRRTVSSPTALPGAALLAVVMVACSETSDGARYAPTCQDCGSRLPDGGVGTCDDDLLGEGETDVDCGGPNCQPCGPGGRCGRDTDCEFLACADDGRCEDATCRDRVANATETDVDCGGPRCPPCLDARGCEAATDCLAQTCSDGLCTGSELAQFEFPSPQSTVCDNEGSCGPPPSQSAVGLVSPDLIRQGTTLTQAFTGTGLAEVHAAMIELRVLNGVKHDLPWRVTINGVEVGTIVMRYPPGQEGSEGLTSWQTVLLPTQPVAGTGAGDDYEVELFQTEKVTPGAGAYLFITGGELRLYRVPAS